MTEIRLALRALAKTPGFTVVALLTLTLAIGVNSGIFALVHAAVFRPLVPDRPGALVNLFNGRAGSDRDFRPFSHAEFLALRTAGAPLADVAALASTRAGVEGPSGLRRSIALFTSENYFELLGVQPAAGRYYSMEECRPGAEVPVIVASYALWQANGGNHDFVGSTVRVNGRPYTVIGITPKGFNGLSAFMSFDVWVPLGLMGSFNSAESTQLAHPAAAALLLTARLQPGAELSALNARLAGLAALLTNSAANPKGESRVLVAEKPSRDGISSSPRGGDGTARAGIIVIVMAGGVLVIACLNLANLFLARGARRTKEFAVRAALGGGRWQVVRQLLVEGLLVSFAGGTLGLLLATLGNDALVRAFTATADLHGETLALNASPGATVLTVTFGLCTAATLLFSLGPALRASRVDLVSALKQSSTGTSGADRFQRFFSVHHCLVMGQVALSMALLFCAALFFRGALAASRIDPGFPGHDVLVAHLDYSLTSRSPADARQSAFAFEERMTGLPGVRAAALATFVPYSSRTDSRTALVVGAPADTAGIRSLYAGITPGYFDALGLRLLSGRSFTVTEANATGKPQVVIIDTTLAGQLFPTGDALGRTIRFGSDELEVIGICRTHRHTNRASTPVARAFVPYGAVADGRPYVLVRFQDGIAAGTQAESFRRGARAIDPELPLLQLASMDRLIEQDFTTWMSKLGAAVFGFFGALALMLAVVGVYAVKSYAVLSRTREIGIRAALGAQSSQILGLLLRQSMLQLALASIVGLGTALAAGKGISRLLYQVSGSDPVALAASLVVLGLTAFAASLLPAIRATRINPIEAIRAE